MPRQKKQNEMHPEIERKFLIRSSPPERWYAEEYFEPFVMIDQFYLRTEFPIVRVRFATAFGPNGLAEDDDPKVSLAMKMRKNTDDWKSQQEFEIAVPAKALRALDFKGMPSIKKMRYRIRQFDFDIFMLQLTGLKLLEIELSNPSEEVVIPEGFEVIEVTDDPRFRGEKLAQIKTNEDLQALLGSVTCKAQS